jgi:hypothetical protein
MVKSIPASLRNKGLDTSKKLVYGWRVMLDTPIKLGVMDVMVINPVFGTISMVISMDAERMVLTSKEEKAEYAEKCTDVAMRYLRRERFINPKERSKWRINFQINPK